MQGTPSLVTTVSSGHMDECRLAPAHSVSFSRLGGYDGEVANAHFAGSLFSWIESLDQHLEAAGAELIYRLRNRIFKLPGIADIAPEGVCLKAFHVPPLAQGVYYARNPGKAEKSYRYSLYLRQHGVGVPDPLAWGRRLVGKRMGESFLLTNYVETPSDFLGEMARLYREDPDCASYVSLLRTVATEIRRMHDAGFIHNDLGGQNILLRRTGERSWGKVRFIDLNRGRILPNVSLSQRARDMAKLDLPSAMREVFYQIYFGDNAIPLEFARWEAYYRARIDFHNRSRAYRHPIRTWRQRKTSIVHLEKVPPRQELWLWDEQSGQPSILHQSKDRTRFRSLTDIVPITGQCLKHGPAVWRMYQQRLAQAWRSPVDMRGRAGITIEVEDADLDGRLDLLKGLEGVPVLLRCHHRLGVPGLALCEETVKRLHASGHEVSLAIVQSRHSVRDPDSWSAYVLECLERMAKNVRFVEIGHAINRVKWGAWNLEEIGRLWQVVPKVRERFPHLHLLGPPVNDFEFHYYPPLLSRWKSAFDSLSCHLYVDRRGAPENKQGRFSTLEKCALGSAIADHFGLKGFYVTEVNWPLTGSGQHSPVRATYELPDDPEHPLHVDEETAAAYMLRYYLISLCSGQCERVWWWRLSSRGFGLADDIDGHRKRPGWHALAFFHQHFGTARFLRKESVEGVHVFHFDRGAIAYAEEAANWTPDADLVHLYDLQGRGLPHLPGAPLWLHGQPVFLLRESS